MNKENNVTFNLLWILISTINIYINKLHLSITYRYLSLIKKTNSYK